MPAQPGRQRPAAVTVDELWWGGWRGPTTLAIDGDRLVQQTASPSTTATTPTTPTPPPPATLHLPVTLLPRLIDHHVHLGLTDPAALLAGGITDAHDLGWVPEIAAGWPEQAAGWREQAAGWRQQATGRRRHDDPRMPRVTIAGALLSCVGGYPSRSGWAPRGATVELASTAEAAAAVAAQLGFGASVIKLTLNSDAGPVPSDALAAAVVAAAHTTGVPVAVHAQGVGQAERALNAGADILAHSPFSERLDERVLARMARAGMVWLSTLDIHGWGRPNAAHEVAVDNVRRFVAARGEVRYGTDLGNGPLPVGVNVRELAALARAGLDRDALVRSMAGAIPGLPPAEEAARPSAPGVIRAPLAWVAGTPPTDPEAVARWLAGARAGSIEELIEEATA